MTVHIRLRRDTAANWTAVNPILLVGETGLETDTRQFKVGDGVNAWTGLSYWGAAGSVVSAGMSTLGNTVGNTGFGTNRLVLAGGNNVTLSGSTNGGSMTITISAGAGGGGGFSGGVSNIGNTAGNTGTQTGTFLLAGGNNVTLSVSTAAGGAQTITVSGPNTVAQTNQSLGIYGSSQTTGASSSSTYDARSLTIVGQGANSVGWTNGSLIISAPNTIAQSNQVGSLYAVGNTTGLTSSNTYDARSLSFSGAGAVSVGWSAASLIISAPNTIAQTNQTLSLLAQPQSAGNTSGVTVDARTINFSGAGAASVGFTTGGGSTHVLVSVPTQTNQSMGLYASSQTTGQSSSSTYDARSLTVVGQGIISVGLSAGSLLISATAGAGGGGFTGGVSTGGNTAGNTGTQTGQFVLAGGNNVTLSVSTAAGGAQTITVSGPNTVAQTNQSLGIYASSQTTGASSSSTYDARSLTMVFSNNISGGWTNGSFLFNVTTAAQTNQTGNIYGSSQTTGQSSSSSYDHRTLTIVGMGANSVGWSAGSLLISAPNTIAQTNQTVGLYHTGNTTGQSSSSTVDARSMSFSGLGIASVGMSAGMVLISVPAGGGGGDGYNIVSMLTSTSGGGTAGATFSALSASIGLMAGSNITLSQTSNTIVINGPSGGALPTLSYYEPDYVKGATLTQSNANGTVYFQPFRVDENISMYRMNLVQQLTTQATTTMSLSASISNTAVYSATGRWGQSGTVMLFSRVSTGTNTNSSRLISFYSNSYSYSVGVFASLSASTSADSATASHTTAQQVGFISNIGSDGAVTTGSITSSGSSTFSSTSAAANSFSSSRAFSFASANFSQVRPIFVPFATSLTPGDYWLAHIQSSSSGSTNLSLQRVASLAPGILYYTTNTSGYAEIGSTATIASSNFRDGWGSYSASSQTSTTIPLTQISNMSQYQMYFQMMAAIK